MFLGAMLSARYGRRPLWRSGSHGPFSLAHTFHALSERRGLERFGFNFSIGAVHDSLDTRGCCSSNRTFARTRNTNGRAGPLKSSGFGFRCHKDCLSKARAGASSTIVHRWRGQRCSICNATGEARIVCAARFFIRV